MNSKELVKSVVKLSFLGLLAWVLFKIKLGLLYIFIALILTLIINPLNKFFKCKFKINNTLSSIFSISILISFFSLVIGLFVPILSKQGRNLSLLNTNEFREKFESTRVSILKYFESQNISLLDFFTDLNLISEIDFSFVTKLFNSIISQIGSLSIGILSVLFITFFLIKDGNNIFKYSLSLFPSSQRKKLSQSFLKIENLLTRYFSGVLIQISILFIFYFLLLLILGVENSLAIAFICAVLNIIPYIGPLISIVLMIILAATNNLDAFIFSEFLINSVWLFSGFIIIQLMDNFLLQPYIFSSSIKSHPLEVFVVIIFSGLLFGIFGLIIAIPLYTTFKVIYNSFFDTRKNFNHHFTELNMLVDSFFIIYLNNLIK